MSFLKKEKEKTDFSSKKTKSSKKNTPNKSKDVIVKKKTKISFGRKKNKNLENNFTTKKIAKEEVEKPEDIFDGEIVQETNSDKNDILENVFVNEGETEIPEKQTEKQWSPQKKKKKILTKDMKGKPVYLEDTGEKLGTIHDMMYDAEDHLIGYKMKDNKTDSILSFPVDQYLYPGHI